MSAPRWVAACALVAGLVVAAGARPQTAAPPPATGPAWKPIFQNKQLAYYVDASRAQPSGPFELTLLEQFTLPRVIDGAQVWSLVSRIKIRCDQKEIATLDITLHALKMGAGPAIASQPIGEALHEPQPGSLGAIVWSAACAKP